MGRLDDVQADGKLLLLAGDFLTMLLLTAGCALAFLSGYRIVVDQGAVIAFCIFASAVSIALHRASQPWWSLLSLAGLIGLYWYYWEEIFPVLTWIGQKMNLVPVSAGLALAMTPKDDILMPVVLLLCASLAWETGWTVVRARRWYLAALVSVVLLLPALQMGVLPAWGAVLMTFAGWGSMLLTGLFGRKDPGSLGRAQLLSLGGMMGLILLLVMALPMEGYLRPQWATDARTNLIRGATRQLEKFFDLDELNQGIFADLGIDLSIPGEGGEGDGTGGEGEGTATGNSSFAMREDLLSVGPRRYSNRRFLSVRSNQPGGGRVYLRGASLSRYTGTAWEQSEEGDAPFFGDPYPEAMPSLYPAATAGDAPEYTMTIRDIAYRGSSFYPYRLTGGWGVTDEAGRITLPWELEWDYNPTLMGEEEYVVGYCPGSPADGFTPLTGELAGEERQYREEVVVPRYHDLLPQTRNFLYTLLDRESSFTVDVTGGMDQEAVELAIQEAQEQYALPTLEDFGGVVELRDDMTAPEYYEAAMTAAFRTAQLLAARAVYDPDTPAMREGEDFIQYFLQEGRGYCVHFATAGALLLRMQGFATRYVTGYVAELDEQGRGTVMDRDAHAWVEVYIDGYGWHPVEMTPGYAGGESGVDLIGALESEGDEDSEDVPGETPEEDDAPEDEEESEDEASSENELPGEEEPEEEHVSIWKVLGGITLTLTALGGAYALSLLPGKLARQDPDPNRSVIRAYQRYRRLLRWGGTENETLEELGRKAKFSQHILTEEERAAAWSSLDASVEHARGRQPKWGKWLFPLLKPLF